MTAPRYIEHLTLTTGHTRRCWRQEVADDVLAMLRPLIDRAVSTGRHVPLPDVVSPRCTITAVTSRGRALMVSIWAPAVDGPDTKPDKMSGQMSGRMHRFTGPTPLVTLGVAPTSLAGAELWRQMVPGGGEEQVPRPAAPAVPWCAVKIYDTAALWPEAMSWLGDFERCLAWAWVQTAAPEGVMTPAETLWAHAWQALHDAGLRYDAVEVSHGDGDTVFVSERDGWRLTVGRWGASVADSTSGDVQVFDRVEDAVAHIRGRQP